MSAPGPASRWRILGPLLAATLAATLYVASEDETDPPPETRKTRPVWSSGFDATGPEGRARQPAVAANEVRAQAGKASGQSVGVGSGKAAGMDTPAIDPFRAQSWYVAPPPPPPPRPVAPPLPFRYLGSLEEGGERRLFLVHQERQWIVKEGDVVASQYRVDEIAPGRVVFTYLPLQTQQTLLATP